MIAPEIFFSALRERGVGLFAGVPDSLLSSFCAYVDDHVSSTEHVITANEGNAIALAAGYHLASGKVAAVYMQNSGLGNTVNPLTSLADPEVYRVPMLLIVGWRGEPGIKDEPQHVKQGRITLGQLDLLEIPYWVLDAQSDADSVLSDAFSKLRDSGAPVALVVKKDTFNKYKAKPKQAQQPLLGREAALRHILTLASPSDLIVSTTGKTSRELYELRTERSEPQRDFLTVGGMGHTSSIALGIAMGRPEKRVICLDGDGSVLMHMGALPIIGSLKPNLIHVVLNNAAHESVGGQPTVAGNIDFRALALACGYAHYEQATSQESLDVAWANLATHPTPTLIEVKISIGSRDDLGRPSSTPEENKLDFIKAVHG